MQHDPSPDLTGYRRLLIFGGSFDPPHRAHVELPAAVAKAIGADVVVYIPAGRAPHKLDKVQTDPAQRLAMLRLALSPQEGAIGDIATESGCATVVLDDEIRRAEDGRPSYTVDTLEALAKRIHPDATMRLLIGTDQVDIFEKWYRWERVVELAEPVVMRRPATGEDQPPALPPVWEPRTVELTVTDLSSTAVRQRVRDGQTLEGWVHPAVADYIADHGLYRESD